MDEVGEDVRIGLKGDEVLPIVLSAHSWHIDGINS